MDWRYVNHEFKDYLAEKGIIAERTASYTPEQNGRSERDNSTIAECARSIMEASQLEEELWAELCVAATYILNRTPTKQAPGSTVWTLDRKEGEDFTLAKNRFRGFQLCAGRAAN